NGVRRWGTYYGGPLTSGLESGQGICNDDSGNVYITGYTSSTTLIASTGAFKTAFSGVFDAFIVKFNRNGVRQWGTYYGGTGSDDGVGIAVDTVENIYFTGSTGSTTGMASSGSFQTTLGGGANDALLVKFAVCGAAPVITAAGRV